MKPRVLLLAGMLNNERLWAPVVRLLESCCEAQGVSFLDHATIDDMAQFAWQAAGDMPTEQPLVIAGFSMGGYVMQAMLARPARPINAVSLISSSVRPESPDTRANRLKTLNAIDNDFAVLVEQIARWATHPRLHADTHHMNETRAIMREVGAHAARLQMQAIACRDDHRPLMQSLAIPMQVVCGRQDRVTPPELSEEAAQLTPGAALHWLDDTGHLAPLERPRELSALLIDLMKPWLPTGGTPPLSQGGHP